MTYTIYEYNMEEYGYMSTFDSGSYMWFGTTDPYGSSGYKQITCGSYASNHDPCYGTCQVERLTLSVGMGFAFEGYTYICCSDGSWREWNYDGYGTDYAPPSCPDYSEEQNISLGNHLYCTAVGSLISDDPCVNIPTADAVETMDADWAGNNSWYNWCKYNSPTSCSSTGTRYCDQNYFLNSSNTCSPCPNGGKTDGTYNTTGITACYLDPGTSFTDSVGTYACGGKAYYKN